jgi:hypothetical protein
VSELASLGFRPKSLGVILVDERFFSKFLLGDASGSPYG